jgi:Glycosyltransferase like family 2
LSDRPRVSVVVAASDSAEAVANCVASLAAEDLGPAVEVLVVADRARMSDTLNAPWVVWIAAEPGADVPRLRRLGLERARSEVVAFTEDSCTLGPGWVDAWRRAFLAPNVLAATGPVEPSDRFGSVVDWAVFFCEYAPFLRPMCSGTAARLAGNNFAARRDDAMNASDALGLHESHLAQELVRRREQAVVVPDALARHVRQFSLRVAIEDRLRFGFAFGRLRAVERSYVHALLGVAAGPAILGAQVGRLCLTLATKQRLGGRFLDAFALTIALLTAWSIGEWLGSIRGLLPVRSPAYKTHERAGQTRRRAAARAASSRAGCKGTPARV